MGAQAILDEGNGFFLIGSGSCPRDMARFGSFLLFCVLAFTAADDKTKLLSDIGGELRNSASRRLVGDPEPTPASTDATPAPSGEADGAAGTNNTAAAGNGSAQDSSIAGAFKVGASFPWMCGIIIFLFR